MLVYIRESDKEKIICDVDEKDIAEHLRVKTLMYKLIFHLFDWFPENAVLCLTFVFILLQIRLKKEQEEKEDKRKYKAQAHLYTIIKVVDD